MKSNERALHYVPRPIGGLLGIALSLQIICHQYLPSPNSTIQPLTLPPSIELLKLSSFGDTIVSARLLMLWLQQFDTQNGQFLSYKRLDYNILQQWLTCILQLDSRTEYPLFATSYLYLTVADPNKQTQMLEFIYQQFFLDPTRRWKWLAHAAVVAKHRLHNLPLALKYAQAIATHATPDMPRWAHEMQIFILEDMGEWERAQQVIGGILSSGQLTDLNAKKFLNDKLLELQHQAKTIVNPLKE